MPALPSRGCSPVSGMLVLATLLPVTSAQGLRVSPPMAREPGLAAEDVFAFQLSPDGRWAVYLADPEQDDRFELFSAPADGSGSSRKLNPPLVAGGNLVQVWHDPDQVRYQHPRLQLTASGRVIYGGDQETDGVLELFSAPIDGSAPPLKLNGPLPRNGDVWDESSRFFDVSEPADRVVYVADQDRVGVEELFSAPLDGSAPPLKLNGPLVSGGAVSGSDSPAFVLSPDGGRVVYRADQEVDEVFELWSAPVDGSGAPVKLSAALATGGSVLGGSQQLSPDGSRVLYLDRQATPERVRLWSAPIDGSASAVRLDAALLPGASVQPGEVAIRPDSAWVFYCADQELDGRIDLHAVPIAGGPSVRLAVPGDVPGAVQDIRCAPDGERLTFRAPRSGARELWSVRADGSAAPVLLSGPLVAGGDVGGAGRIGPDARTVVFVADRVVDDVHELWSVPIDGRSAPARLNGALPAEGDVLADQFLLDARGRVLYLADQRRNSVHELWSVPMDRSHPPLRLNGALTRGGDVSERSSLDPQTGFQVGLDAARVLYRADQRTDELFALWSVPLDRSQPPVELNVALDAGPVLGDVVEYAWAGDGSHLVFSADVRADEAYEVFSASTERAEAGRFPLLRLGDGRGLRPSPDGTWVAFAPRATCEPIPYCTASAPLWCASIDASLPARILNLGLGGFASSYRFGPDGSWLVFEQFELTYRDSFQGLFGTPVLGGEPVSLTEPQGMLPEPWAMRRFVISPTGERVVYTHESPASDAALASVPIDRSLPPVELIEPLGYPQDLDDDFRITPDGRQVVLVGDLRTPGVHELFLTASDGAGGPVALLPLPADRDVDGALRLAPDGSCVVFVADLASDDVFELWSVPLSLARRSPVVRLSAKPVPGGDVALGALRVTGEDPYLRQPQFELGPDGARVVYRADQEQDGVHELFSAPLDGHAAPVRLHPPLGPGQEVELFGFRIAPDGAHVVYAADPDEPDVLELFAVPIDASAPPWKLSGSMAAGGDLWTHPSDGAALSFALTPDATQVVFLADRESDGVVELFVVPLDGSAAPRKLNAALIAGGDVAAPHPDQSPFAIRPDGRAVAYLADQEQDEVFELFLSFLADSRARPAAAPGPLRR